MGDQTGIQAKPGPIWRDEPGMSGKRGIQWHETYSLHGSELCDNGVGEDSDLWIHKNAVETFDKLGLALRAFMFFKSIPTSAVTPSPNLRLEAATYWWSWALIQTDPSVQPTSNAYSFWTVSTGVANERSWFMAAAWWWAWWPAVEQPWHGQADCWVAAIRREMTLLEAIVGVRQKRGEDDFCL